MLTWYVHASLCMRVRVSVFSPVFLPRAPLSLKKINTDVFWGEGKKKEEEFQALPRFDGIIAFA